MSDLSSAIHNTGHHHVRPRPVCLSPSCGAQASYLRTLSEQAHQPDAYEPNLTKAEASKRIEALRQLFKDRGR